MKVLLVNTHDTYGGAAKAAYRLHQALRQAGFSSMMVVRHKNSDDRSVVPIADLYQGRSALFDALPVYPYKKVSNQIFSSAMLRNPPLLEFINSSDADVIHIHWIALGFISLEDIQKINKPIVFSLHDMWLFTGGCHYTQGCQAYLTACQACPTLQSKSSCDLSNTNFKRKLQLFTARKNIAIVGLSRWITEEAKRSSILLGNRIEWLPNPADTKTFHPIPKNKARLKLKLTLDAPTIIFAADGGTKDPRKGYKFLSSILSGQLSKHRLHVVTFGNSVPEQIVQGNHSIQHLTAIEDEQEIALLLSAANLVVLPSVQENLSNLVLESLSCGTPVIAFDIGGNSDMIKHLENGYLAQFPDSQDLEAGVIWGLSHTFDKDQISDDIIARFGYSIIASKYIALYQSLLNAETQLATEPLQSLLLKNNHTAFEWTTSELEAWIDSIKQLNKRFFIYGFGILGKYLQSKLASYCVAVIDLNYASYQDKHPTVNFMGLQDIERLSKALIIMSIYDTDLSIRHSIESRVNKDTTVLSLFEHVTKQKF